MTNSLKWVGRGGCVAVGGSQWVGNIGVGAGRPRRLELPGRDELVGGLRRQRDGVRYACGVRAVCVRVLSVSLAAVGACLSSCLSTCEFVTVCLSSYATSP